MKLTKKPRNPFEKRIFGQLRRAKVTFHYEHDKIPYVVAGHYLPDFTVETATGKIYIETKGYFRPEAKRKMVAVKKLNPQLDIRLVFYSHKPKDIKWAERYGFKWAIEKVPKEWLQ